MLDIEEALRDEVLPVSRDLQFSAMSNNDIKITIMDKPNARKTDALKRRATRVGLVLYPGCMPAGLMAMTDLLKAVNVRMGRSRFEVVWLSVDRAAIYPSEGLRLRSDCDLDDDIAEALDVVVVPGFWAEPVAHVRAVVAAQIKLVSWLKGLPKSTQLWSYCMGVALIAAAGKLDKHRATTTWWFQETLSSQYPRVKWDFSAPLLQDGTLTTAASPNGYWAILEHHLARSVRPDVMRDVMQWMVLPRPASLHPAFRPVELLAQRDPELQSLLAYVQTVPASELDLAVAADYLALSARTLSRRVQASTGVSAGAWLRLVKLRQVSDALVVSKSSVKDVSHRLGFADEPTLHRAFKQATGLTTGQYRQKYTSVVG